MHVSSNRGYPEGPRLVGLWSRRSIPTAAPRAAQWFSLDDVRGCPGPLTMLTREQVVRWLAPSIRMCRGGAEASPVQPVPCRRSACGRRGLCPCALIGRPRAALSYPDESAAPLARASPSVRSADTAEPFPGGQPVKPRRPGCHPVPLPMGPSGPSVFSALLALPVGAIGATRWPACRLSTGFRPGL